MSDAEHLFMSVDGKNDFVIFNSNMYMLSDDALLNSDVKRIEFINQTTLCKSEVADLKSKAWSSGCNFFFLLQPEGIYFFSVHPEIMFLCIKKTKVLFDWYLAAIAKKR